MFDSPVCNGAAAGYDRSQGMVGFVDYRDVVEFVRVSNIEIVDFPPPENTNSLPLNGTNE